MKPNQVSFAESFGLNKASLDAIKKRELKNVVPDSTPQKAVPLSAGADAFAFRNHGIAELFQGKQINR